MSAEKDFSVPVEQLYKAWITPEDLKQWWHPSDNKLKTVELDIREGGALKYEFEGPDGNISVVITGEYKEAKPNEKLVYTWNWQVTGSSLKQSDHQLSITFQPAGQGSKISVVQENLQSDESITPHREGWEKALDDLFSYLNK